MQLRVPAADLALRDTLECGQAFRWRVVDGRYAGYIGRAAVHVAQDGAELLVKTSDASLTPERIRHYFALDLPLSAILSSIDVDAQIHRAIERHRGLRVLRQDPWECLASFICSSFNNIVRIQGMIERLCEAFGEPVEFDGFRGWTFPAPRAIAAVSERRLRALGLGFRAPYLHATARLVADGGLPLETLQRADYRTTMSALLACDGVGEKVADCVALFGCEKYEAFPVDVWVERAMRYYFGARRLSLPKTRAFAHRHFGRYAGYAQQYLYHDIRTTRAAPVRPPAPRRRPILAYG